MVLAAVVFGCPLWVAHRIPLLDPDEGLHASIAQEMVERGDWIVPRQFGEPFLDKPILYFWAEALSLKCFGQHEAAVRLPGMLFGLAGALTTMAVAWRLFGRMTGIVSGCFYMTMMLPTALTQVPCHDIAMIPWVNLALLSYWQSDRVTSRRASLLWTLSAGGLLGLALLTKGLTGIALVGITYGAYLLISREFHRGHVYRASLSLFVACITGGSWYVIVEQRIPGFIHYYFFERHILGFVTDSQPHGAAAWWYYLPFFIGGGLPWVAYLPVTWSDAWSRPRERTPSSAVGRPQLFVACWLICSVLFLSSAHSKLVTYIWPVFPAIAILAAIPWVRAIDGTLNKIARRMMRSIIWGTCLFAPAIIPIVFAVSQSVLPVHVESIGWCIGLAAAFSVWLPLWYWEKGQVRATIVVANLSVVAQLATVMLFVFPQVAGTLSAPELARHINRSRELPSRLLVAQERVGSVIFYLDPKLRAKLHGASQIDSIDIDDPLPKPVLGSDLIALPERHLHTALSHYQLQDAPYVQAGRFRIYDRAELLEHLMVASHDNWLNLR